MTSMITPPENEDYKALLAEYMKDAEDGGFSDNIMKTIKAQERQTARRGRLARLRIGFIMGGCFMGGIIAAAQLKPAWAMLSDTASQSGPFFLATLFTLFAFAVWTSLDNRDAGTL